MATTKLTLSISKRAVSKAKRYAKMHGTSISFLVERFINDLTKDQEEEKPISESVQALKGMISIPKDYDYKNDLGNLYQK